MFTYLRIPFVSLAFRPREACLGFSCDEESERGLIAGGKERRGGARADRNGTNKVDAEWVRPGGVDLYIVTR